MTTKSITITEEAYNFLKEVKGNRSFSELILSMSRSAEDILKYAGSLQKADLKSIENVREEANRDWNHRR